jgi:hypothetical protein
VSENLKPVLPRRGKVKSRNQAIRDRTFQGTQERGRKFPERSAENMLDCERIYPVANEAGPKLPPRFCVILTARAGC